MLTAVQNLNDRPWPRAGFAILLGVIIGTTFALAFFSLKPVWIILVPFAVLVFLPTLLLSDVKLYWLLLFVFALQFDVKKNLLDASWVPDVYGEFAPFVFVPELRLSDLALLVLLAFWLHNVFSRRQPFYFPRPGWLAVGFIAWTAFSLVKAVDPYLGVVELMRECKFFLIYLYAVNNIDSRRLRRAIGAALLVSIALQGAVTILRYELQYFEPFFGDAFGESGTKKGELTGLVIDPSAGDLKASFGTLLPGVMAQYLVLSLPLALMLVLRNPVFRKRWLALAIWIVGSLGLFLTYSRSNFVAYGTEVLLCGYLSLRRGYISKRARAAVLLLAVVAGVLAAPVVYTYMNRKLDNISIRFEQYKIAFAMIRANPVLGVGLNNHFSVAASYSTVSRSPRDSTSQATDNPVHGFYLSHLAEIGVPGFVLYLGFFAAVCLTALRLSRSPADPEVAFSATVLLVAVLGLGIAILTNTLSADPIQTLLWFYAGTILAFSRVDRSPTRRA